MSTGAELEALIRRLVREEVSRALAGSAGEQADDADLRERAARAAVRMRGSRRAG